MISEQEAQQSVIALMTAMFHNDKQAREILYADMDNDSLKRIIRWSVRQNINMFASLCIVSGQDPEKAWSDFAMMANIAINHEEEE